MENILKIIVEMFAQLRNEIVPLGNETQLTMNISFTFVQILQTAHPDVHVPVRFAGEAEISDDGIEILSVFECSLRHDLKIPKGLEAQNLAAGEMGKFLARCRMAAIDAENERRMSFDNIKYMENEW